MVTNNFTVLVIRVYSGIFALVNELNSHLIIRHRIFRLSPLKT